MAEQVQNNTLRNQHYVTVILRFALDARGRLIEGELVDTRHSLLERFLGEAGLYEALAAWLGQQKEQEGGEGEFQPVR